MATCSRRSFLRTGTLALAGALGLARGANLARAAIEVPCSVIGLSQSGLPLVVYHLGEGRRRIFILGGQHGGPEYNTVRLAHFLLEHFEQHPQEIPPGLGLDIIPEGNPDGVATDSRQYLSGVDPNRNWGGSAWNPDAYDSNGHFRPGLGGSEPFSEQETRALRDWLLQTRPALMINYHSQGGFMFGSGDLADVYSEASGYPRPTPRPGGGSVLSYRATGSTNVWLRTADIPGIFIELSNTSDPEFRRNLAGVRAVLAHLAANAVI